MDYCYDFPTQHKHILFVKPIDLLTMYKIITRGKYKNLIIYDDQKITYNDQKIFFKFDTKSNNKIIGLESEIIHLEDYDRFYTITEYIGSINNCF